MKSARLKNRLNVKIKFIKYVINQYFICACGEIGRHARFRFLCREACRFDSCQAHHLYVTKKITCQKSPIFRTFLRIWTLKFHSQNRGSPKALFECFWDLNGRFLIFMRIESRFGRKIPNSALFYCKNLSQSFRRFLVRYAELIEK